MKYRYLFIFLIPFIISCGGKMMVKHETTEPSGAPFPVPHYVLQTIDPKQPIRITFFYRAITTVEDLDGKQVPQETFLDRRQTHYFASEGTVHLVARVLNPRNLKYKIFCKERIHYSAGGYMDSLSEVAYSDMKYREFIRELPLNDGIEKVSYAIRVTGEKGNLLLTTGNFEYSVN